MKAVEFEGRLANDGQIQLPPDVARQIPEGSDVRVILLFGANEDEDWRQLSLRRFAEAYSEEDAGYEKLLDGSAPR